MEDDIFGGDIATSAAKYFFKKQYARNYFKGFNFNKLEDNRSAIYVLYAKDEDGSTYCLYVGETTNVKRRLQDHIRNYQLVDIRVIPFRKKPTREERLHYERVFINLFKPRLNLKNTWADVFGEEILLKHTDIDLDNYDQYTLEQLKQN